MKNLEALFLTITIIVIVSLILYFFGVTYYNSVTCPACDQTLGLTKYSFIPTKVISAVTFIPLQIYSFLHPYTNLTKDLDINGALALFLSIFSYFLAVYLISIGILALYSKFTSSSDNKPSN